MKIILWIFLSLSVFGGSALASDQMQEKKSDHFIVYYDADVSGEFADTVLEYAEKYHGELTNKLGFTRYDYWTWDNRAKIYIYADQETYARETKQPSWSGGAASYETKTIWTFPREAGFFDSLLPHEIGHIIFREVIGAHRVPLWLEEGVASYLETAKRFGSEKIVMDALRDGSFVPLMKLSKMDAYALRGEQSVVLFYAEAISVISFLINKFGVDRFNRMCEKIRAGKSLDVALGYAYFDISNEEDLGALWERSLRDKSGVKIRTML
jgi:hypothetical protein